MYMEEADVKRLALVLAVQAEIEGMKVENEMRKQRDESPAYNEGHFQEKASYLRDIAYSHRDQL